MPAEIPPPSASSKEPSVRLFANALGYWHSFYTYLSVCVCVYVHTHNYSSATFLLGGKKEGAESSV